MGTPKVTTNKQFGKTGTEAAAVSDGTLHAAAVKALHVMLLPDGEGWFAQGLEIDYFACGKTLEETKANFANGLCLTVNEHLLMYGNVDKVLVPASKEDPIWSDFYKLPPQLKTEILNFATACRKPDDKGQAERVADALNFDTIQFIERERIAA